MTPYTVRNIVSAHLSETAAITASSLYLFSIFYLHIHEWYPYIKEILEQNSRRMVSWQLPEAMRHSESK